MDDAQGTEEVCTHLQALTKLVSKLCIKEATASTVIAGLARVVSDKDLVSGILFGILFLLFFRLPLS